MGLSDSDFEELRELVGQDPRAALVRVRDYDRHPAADRNWQRNRSAFLIDIGSSLHDAQLINDGIDDIHAELASTSKPTSASTLYNLANGYSALDHLQHHQPGYVPNPLTSPLRQAKQYYREALKTYEAKAQPASPQLLTNYGNCLAQLGRSLEAITQYQAALKRQPDHPMAWGQLGVELWRFAPLAGSGALVRDAYEAICHALDGEALERAGEGHARQSFKRTRERIEQYGASALAAPQRACTPPTYSSEQHKRYVDFCWRHQLFLNLHVRDSVCQHAVTDSALLSITTPIDDQARFIKLARVINESKETFAVARLLAFEAQSPPYSAVPYDSMTRYIDNLDYAVYGIRVGKLKLAFEQVYNVLDKLAFFINDYLGLGVAENAVNFESILLVPKPRTVLPAVEALGNRHLYALLDISLDLSKGGYLEHLKQTRNLLTHRYLVPHVEGSRFEAEVDGPEYHLRYQELENRVIAMLQLTKNAVVYLIAFIQREEDKHQRDSSKKTMPMYYQAYDPSLADAILG